jgi:hypothetical protein
MNNSMIPKVIVQVIDPFYQIYFPLFYWQVSNFILYSKIIKLKEIVCKFKNNCRTHINVEFFQVIFGNIGIEKSYDHIKGKFSTK